MTDRSVTLIGQTHAVRALDLEITLAARSDAKVLITGESGVGKEIAACLIHQRSGRANGVLLTLNCAGVPESLLETELFGHVRGSFTGAVRDKAGLFEQANGGSVFLDEIGEMSLRMQAMLLRFLETGEVQRVGADRMGARLDVRVICATNRDLSQQIARGEFREDLYYRLNVIHLKIPALRERKEDIPLLVDHFLTMFAEQHRMARPVMDPAAVEAIIAYEWPGNIRQLKNVLERMVVRAKAGMVLVCDLPPELRRLAVAAPDTELPPAEALAEYHARGLYDRMVEHRESFWTAIHDAFMARDITRDTVRRVVRLGLEHGNGRYSEVVELFNVGKDDQKRFIAFLRKHDCLVPGDESRARRSSSRSVVASA